MEKSVIEEDKKIKVRVCAACYRASCWKKINMCGAPVKTGFTHVSLAWLKKMKMEDSRFWY